jgi:hypothetical protein
MSEMAMLRQLRLDRCLTDFPDFSADRNISLGKRLHADPDSAIAGRVSDDAEKCRLQYRAVRSPQFQTISGPQMHTIGHCEWQSGRKEQEAIPEGKDIIDHDQLRREHGHEQL